MTMDAARKLTVGEIIMGEDGYRIPEYQRNYAWTATEITQLIADIHLAHAAQQPSYFLGNIVTTRTRGEHDVVDGQQRLTTLVLLISYLRIALGRTADASLSIGHPLAFASRSTATVAIKRLSTATSQESALDALEGDITIDEDDATENTRGPVQGLRTGYLAIQTTIEEQLPTSSGEMNAFLDYLLNRVEMIRVVLPQGTDLNRYFEVMNTRGVQLEPTDIVRAKLMSALAEDAAQMRAFRRVWDACAQMEGYVQINISRGDTTLREQLFGKDWEWLQVTSFDRLTELLGAEAAGGDDFLVESRDLGTALQGYLQDSPLLDADDEENANRQYRATIRFPFLLLHALALFEKQHAPDPDPCLKVGEDSVQLAEDPALNDKRLIKRFDEVFSRATDASSTSPAAEMVRLFALHLLRVRNVFDAYIVRRHLPGPATSDDDGTWVLKSCRSQRARRKVNVVYRDTFGQRNGDEDSDEQSALSSTRSDQRDLVLLESMLRVTYTSPRSMRWITDLLGRALTHHFPHPDRAEDPPPKANAIQLSKELRLFLQELVRERIRSTFFSDSPRDLDQDSLATRVAPKTGFDIPRIVFTYLDYLMLDTTFTDDEPASTLFKPVASRDFVFRFRNSVEHFAPRTRDEETDRTEVTEPWMNSLGNLALVTVRQNSKFSNASPASKSESSDAVLQQSPKLWRMARLTAMDRSWTNTQIQAHHEECMDLLHKDLFEAAEGQEAGRPMS